MPQFTTGQRVRWRGRVGVVTKPPKYGRRNRKGQIDGVGYDPMTRVEFGDGTRRLVDCAKLEVAK